MFKRYTYICVGKIEMHDGRVISFKDNLSVKFSDCLLCGISVA